MDRAGSVFCGSNSNIFIGMKIIGLHLIGYILIAFDPYMVTVTSQLYACACLLYAAYFFETGDWNFDIMDF